MTLLSSQHRTFRSASFGAAAGLALLASGIAIYRTAAADDEKKPAAAASDEAPKGDAAKNDDSAADVLAIRKSASAFVAAFDRGDARGIASLWTAAGTLTDEDGTPHKGREAIEKAYAAFFKQNPGAKLSIRIESISSPAPGVAVEDGTAQVVVRGEAPSASRYTAFHVLKDGKWQMASVRESRLEAPSNAGRLQELSFLVGDWTTSRGDTTVRLSFRWIANRSFLQQTSTVTQGGIAVSSGMHVIGWDPESDRFRSWAFDSTGGFGSGLWSPTEHGYHIDSRGLLSDGTPTSSNDFLVRGDDHVLGWRSIDRYAGDTRLPDMAEVVLDRVAEQPGSPAPKTTDPNPDTKSDPNTKSDTVTRRTFDDSPPQK